MIVWIDEEERTTYPSRLLMEKKGFEVIPVANATDGYNQIVKHMDTSLKLAIVDVMLLQGADLVTFDDDSTRGGVLTGLVLVSKLIADFPDYPWTKNLIVFSRASDPDIVNEITNFCKINKITYFRKGREYRARRFIEWLYDNKMLS